jgi:biotin transporter BioY
MSAVLVCGASWLGFGFTRSLAGAVTFGIAPFLVGELLKSALAAGLTPRG